MTERPPAPVFLPAQRSRGLIDVRSYFGLWTRAMTGSLVLAAYRAVGVRGRA